MSARKPARTLVRRHSLLVRVTHWLNVLAVVMLLMSGLQIFNAHPALYWGQASTFADPWISTRMVERAGRPIGVTSVAGHSFETTGFLGYSGPLGAREPRGFPAWATIPSYRDLASGRRWHLFFAWVFVVNGLAWWLGGLAGGHVRRDLLPDRRDLSPRNIWHEIATHARLRFPRGEAARRYNVLQKVTYLGVALVLLPLMVATGLTMSPGINAAWPWMLDLFGGRQSARTIHFIAAGLIVAFVIVHLVMVVASGLWNNIRSMITGRYAIETEEARP